MHGEDNGANNEGGWSRKKNSRRGGVFDRIGKKLG